MDKLVIGGQAVIEGVLMRSPNHYAVTVRKPDNSISVKLTKHVAYTKRNWFLGLPLIRGVVVLFESVVIGTKALMHSTNEVCSADEQLTSKELIFTFILSLVAALVIFKFIPLVIANIFSKGFGLNNFWFNLLDGVIKITIFILYIWALSLMDDVKRLFQDHGAEHMAVHCYEAKKKLTVKNVKKYKTMHPRCGTEFLLLVFFVSIALYMFIPLGSDLWLKYVYRILLLPVIAGISYEILKLSGLYYDNFISRVIAAPGMMLQKLTTKKPSDDQIEVAIKSLEAVLSAEKN